MKKPAIILAVSILAAICLITWDATRDSVLKEETVEFEVESSSEEKTIADDNVVQEVVVDVQDEPETESMVTIAEGEKDELRREQENKFAFSRLNTEEQIVYTEILAAITGFQKDVVLSTQSPDLMDKAFSCVMMDHPEIFYIDGYKYTQYTSGTKIKKMTFSGNYTYEKEETDIRNAQIEAAADEIVNRIGMQSSDYEKVKFIYETIVNETEYVLNAPDNQNICSVFLGHRSVCQGYAKAMQYLLNRLGVETTLVVGTVKNGEGHAWNLVRIDGAYYYVDCTWGDAYYLLSSQDMESVGGKTPSINYDYLCVTTQQIMETHTVNTVVDMPECTEIKANYYVMEGSYFPEYNEDKIRELFLKAQENGKETVTLKCASWEIYNRMIQELINGQRVFEFCPELQGSIAYTTCEEQRSISFWL